MLLAAALAPPSTQELVIERMPRLRNGEPIVRLIRS